MKDQIINGGDVTNAFQEGSAFDVMNKALSEKAKINIQNAKGVVFRVKTESRNDLFNMYLNSFYDAAERQSYNCSCCKSFLRKYGNLVYIDKDNCVKSLLWDESLVDPIFKQAVANLRLSVESQPIDSVFYRPYFIDDVIIGNYEKGGFHHFAFNITSINVGDDLIVSSESLSCISRESFKILNMHLASIKQQTVDDALVYFKNDAVLKKQDESIRKLSWLSELMSSMKLCNNQKMKRNKIWFQVATKSKGYIKFANTVIGEFLKTLNDGGSFEDAKAMYLEMTKPERYMRPTAAPTVGNVAAAERINTELGLESALKRRFLSIDEIKDYVWQPKKQEVVDKKGGIFSDLKTKDDDSNTLIKTIDGGTITWDRFEKEILPNAENISIIFRNRNYALGGCITAVHADAKPILKWDSEEHRNPVSGYIHVGGSTPIEFKLLANVEFSISGITYIPEEIFAEKKSSSRFFIIKQANDDDCNSLGLFPDLLRSELFEIRSTIEAYSNKGTLEKVENPCFGLYCMEKSQTLGYMLNVTNGKFKTQYLIDRFN